MPIRRLPLINQEIYHVLNRGVASVPIFKTASDYHRFIDTARVCNLVDQTEPFSRTKEANINFDNSKKQVEILAYCLMPNHFHFLVKQERDDGIVNFISKTSNSYSKFFNIKNDRKGPLFEGRFKAILIETEEQLLHLNRYIHLNPYSAFVVKELTDLFAYPYSSLNEYLELGSRRICNTETIMNSFGANIEKYKNFLVDQADYQRGLQIIKHQVLE